MKTLKENKTFVSIVIAILISSAAVVCLQKAILFRQVSAQNQSQLKLELSTSERKFVQLEPIPFNLKLSNQTTIPIKWNGVFGVGLGISFSTRAEDGSEFRWGGSNSRDILEDTEVVQPGENRTMQTLLDDFLVERLFPHPGRYQFQAEFKYSDYTFGQEQRQTIVSNPITIEIKEPVGNDRRAFEYLKNTYKPVRDGDNTQERLRIQQYMVDNFQNSVYWKYITYDLAEMYLFLKENEKAEREFFKLANIKFHHSKRVSAGLSKLAVKLGRPTPLSNHPLGVPIPMPPNSPIGQVIPTPNTTPGPTPPGPPPVLVPIFNPTPFPSPTQLP